MKYLLMLLLCGTAYAGDVFEYQFEEPQDGVLYDLTGNGYDLTAFVGDLSYGPQWASIGCGERSAMLGRVGTLDINGPFELETKLRVHGEMNGLIQYITGAHATLFVIAIEPKIYLLLEAFDEEHRSYMFGVACENDLPRGSWVDLKMTFGNGIEMFVNGREAECSLDLSPLDFTGYALVERLSDMPKVSFTDQIVFGGHYWVQQVCPIDFMEARMK